jgi:hypothetical protein
MFDCLVCGSSLIYEDGDDRQEWLREWYSCSKCGTKHERWQVRQCQSMLVASDELVAVDGFLDLDQNALERRRELWETSDQNKPIF